MNPDLLPDTTTCLGEETGGFPGETGGYSVTRDEATGLSGASSGEDSGAAHVTLNPVSKVDPR